jgi:hypothetical protein
MSAMKAYEYPVKSCSMPFVSKDAGNRPDTNFGNINPIFAELFMPTTVHVIGMSEPLYEQRKSRFWYRMRI